MRFSSLVLVALLVELQTASAQLRTTTFELGNLTIHIREGVILDTVIYRPAYTYSYKPDTIPAYIDSSGHCEASLEVLRAGRRLYSKRYRQIEGLGGWGGIFVPDTQPLKHYFVAVKRGDYDGRTFIVRQDGKTFNLPGGGFYLTPDSNYLISEYEQDCYCQLTLTVFDVRRGRVVATSKKFDGEPDTCFYRPDRIAIQIVNDEDTNASTLGYFTWERGERNFKWLRSFNTEGWPVAQWSKIPLNDDTSVPDFQDCSCYGRRPKE